MRYLLHKDQDYELPARLVYLYDIFRLYFHPGKPEGEFIALYPVGHREPDYLFITGHANKVRQYLDDMILSIPEKAIVITSCIGTSFKRFASKKAIYVPKQTTPYCEIRNGQPFGFDFRISDPELDFYNADGTISDRLQAAYVLLK